MTQKKPSAMAELFLTFAKIGLFTFGGGYAMISLITSTCVEEKKWLSHDEMMNLTVVAESTPGPIAINCATFVGYRHGGFRGSVGATLGVVLPSFIIIYLISLFLNNFLEIAWIANAFRGIRCCVGILIVDVGVKMLKKMKRAPLPVAIVSISGGIMLLVSLTGVKLSSIVLMLTAGCVSFLAWRAKQRGGSV